MLVPAASLPSESYPAWRELYLQALFEADLTKARLRIGEAERALKRRERELFAGPANKEEREAVKGAMRALRALKLSLFSRTRSHAA